MPRRGDLQDVELVDDTDRVPEPPDPVNRSGSPGRSRRQALLTAAAVVGVVDELDVLQVPTSRHAGTLSAEVTPEAASGRAGFSHRSGVLADQWVEGPTDGPGRKQPQQEQGDQGR